MQLARVRSLDVSVRQVPLRLVGLHDTVAMELGHGTFIKARSIETNIEKLEARYPDGFSIVRSENREEGDI